MSKISQRADELVAVPLVYESSGRRLVRSPVGLWRERTGAIVCVCLAMAPWAPVARGVDIQSFPENVENGKRFVYTVTVHAGETVRDLHIKVAHTNTPDGNDWGDANAAHYGSYNVPGSGWLANLVNAPANPDKSVDTFVSFYDPNGPGLTVGAHNFSFDHAGQSAVATGAQVIVTDDGTNLPGATDVVVRDRNQAGPFAPLACPGDLNCDGTINFKDINPFVLFLSNFSGWQTAYPGCPPENGDTNGDGTCPSFKDINPFVSLLSGGGGSCAP